MDTIENVKPKASDKSQLLYRANWVVPMDQPPVHDGAVVVSGSTILAVGESAELGRLYPDAAISDLGEVALLPGLVNAHAHLELSTLLPGRSPARFVDWLMRLVPPGIPSPGELEASITASVADGVRQCMRYGVTTVGDISRNSAITRRLLHRSPLRVVSFGEVLAMAQRRSLLDARLAGAVDRTYESQRLRIGITPHAPYSVEPDGYRKCLQAARAGAMPLATHLAETPDEVPFLASHAGPFRELWQHLGAWDDCVPRFPGGPIRFAQELGLLDYPTVLAHVNYCDDDELALLAAGRAGVVYCPRTHAYFGHLPHRWREMLAAGINVAVGTDSTASSPNLNLVDDLRLLHRLAPEVSPATLWELATLRAARALGWDDAVGSLTPGQYADMAAFAINGNDPLREILESDALPQGVWIGGQLLEEDEWLL